MRHILFAVVLCLVHGLSAGPALASPLTDAEAAINAGRPEIAIAPLQDIRPATPDEELRRLWALGVALNQLGRFDEAIAPLSRLVALMPQNGQARIELAGALLRTGQPDRARYQLERAQAAGLSPELGTQVQSVLDGLQKPRLWQGTLRFALIPESNAERRTSAQTVTLNGLVFGLLPSARAQAATGAELGFGLAAVPHLSDQLRLRIGGDVFARLFDKHASNDVTVRLNAALLRFDQNRRFTGLEVFGARRWIADQAYTDTRGLSLRHARLMDSVTQLSGGILAERVDYTEAGFAANRIAADVRLVRIVNAQLELRAGLRAERRTSPVSQVAGNAQGFSLGAEYAFQGGLRIGLDLSYDQNRYSGVNPLFGIRRTDKTVTVEVELTNQNWSIRGFAPVVTFGVEQQRSTIPLNRYRNVTSSLGFTRSF